ncbi:MAG: hypothetical protein H6719_25585 [Sandaracinaceae bacterium]|nr:hypothetical protein [Sandaracinaceae bacterium]
MRLEPDFEPASLALRAALDEAWEVVRSHRPLELPRGRYELALVEDAGWRPLGTFEVSRPAILAIHREDHRVAREVGTYIGALAGGGLLGTVLLTAALGALGQLTPLAMDGTSSELREPALALYGFLGACVVVGLGVGLPLLLWGDGYSITNVPETDGR